MKFKLTLQGTPVLIPNRLFVFSWHLFSLVTGHIPKAKIEEHKRSNEGLEHNLISGQTGVFCFIENQQELGAFRFGTDKRSDLSYSGCGIIAVYNIITALEGYPAMPLSALIECFEKRGAVLWGGFGVSAIDIYRFLKRRYPSAGVLLKCDPAGMESFSDKYDAFAVTVWNDSRSLKKGLHTVCITKTEEGYVSHNIYRRDADGRWCRGKECESLYSAVGQTGEYSRPVIITGVRKQNERER